MEAYVSVYRNIEAFQSYSRPLIQALRHPSTVFTGDLLARIRNADRQSIISTGVLFAEVVGFFSVGEMLGRLKLVGYHGETAHH